MNSSKSIESRIIETGGRATGFDYMRLTLAILVIVWHSVPVAYGSSAAKAIMASPYRPFIALILPMFFALSGFLVAGSLERSKTLFVFLGLRVIRIFPALTVEVVISALLLGPLFTTYRIDQYFADPVFFRYFFNIIGHIQYALPGVFSGNPYPNVVNGQLWTVPYELQCYVALAVIAVFGAVKSRVLFLGCIAILTVFGIAKSLTFSSGEIAVATGAVPGSVLVTSFLAGVAVYIYREKLVWNASLACISFVASMILLSVPLGDYFSIIPIAYLTAYLGLLNPAKIKLLKGADYSYGIFLYGFAIQQAVAALGEWSRHWWINVLIALPIAGLIAGLSWHFIEKPALGLRKQLNQLEPKWIALCATLRRKQA